MSGYARVQDLRAKLKPFRKYSGHYLKSPEIKLLLQENVTACQQFMLNKDTSELSTINTKVLLHWAECSYGLGRKFGEKKLLPIACEKYELVAKFTGPQDDFLVYCKWAIAECEKSLFSMFFKDGRGKKALYKKGETLFKTSLAMANKSSTKRSRVLYSWALCLFRYSRSCESLCTSKEVFRMYQKAGQMFYDAYTVNPSNKDAVYKWGKLLDSQALIISHRNDPELALVDDVELFLIVFSSLAMRGKLNNLKILIALCLSPEEVTQSMAIEVLEHLSCFLETPSQIPPTPHAPPSPPPTPLFTPAGITTPPSPFNPSIHPIFSNGNAGIPNPSGKPPSSPMRDISPRTTDISPRKDSSPKKSSPLSMSGDKATSTSKESSRDSSKGSSDHSGESPPTQAMRDMAIDTINKCNGTPPSTNPFETNSQPESAADSLKKASTNPFGSPSQFSKLTIKPPTSPVQPRSVAKFTLPPAVNPPNVSPPLNATSTPTSPQIGDGSNPASVLSPSSSPAPAHRVAQLLGTNAGGASASGVPPRMAPLDLNLNDSGGIMGNHGEFQSPTMEDAKVNQRLITEEAQSVLTWIKQIIVQNHTLTVTTKIQALKSLGDEGQRVWRAAKIPYQEALDNFEIFANCINFHTKRQLPNLQKYLTAPDSLPTSPNSTSPTPISPTPLSPTSPTSPTGLIRSDSAPVVRNPWGDLNANGKGNAEGANGENPPAEPSLPVRMSRQHRSRSFGTDLNKNNEEDQIIIHEDIHKYYVNHNKIGRGGFGDVFTAKSKKTNSTVALKSMRRNFEDHHKQIIREIKLMKASVHPNMVSYIESYSCHDHVWIVMEYCDGGSLRTFAKNTLLEESHISYMSKQILEGLSYLHSHNRIHRDIKADNVLLNLDGSVKLADLGIAADLDDPDTPDELMNLCGSKFWMAPEMIKFKPYNYKVDIWGFGCLLIELAEGRHPYEGQHSMAAMFHTATKGADSLSNPEKWSDLFHDFMRQCFQVNPVLRPSSDDLLQHPFIVLYDTAPNSKEIQEDIVQKLDNVFVGYQIENILF